MRPTHLRHAGRALGVACSALLALGVLCTIAGCGSKESPDAAAPTSSGAAEERPAEPSGGDGGDGGSDREDGRDTVSDPGDSASLIKGTKGIDAKAEEPGGPMAPAPPPVRPDEEKEGGYVYVPPSPSR